jgi:2-oxoglutarate ferredoxin oxidoreductase subunit delta
MSRGRPEINGERCKGCALCVGACPQNILAMSTDKFNKQGVPFVVCLDESKCTACLSCAIICPDVAIRILKPVAAGGD